MTRPEASSGEAPLQPLPTMRVDATFDAFPDPALYWNLVALDVNRLAQSLRGARQGGPPMSARALGIVHLAMHDAWFGMAKNPAHATWLDAGPTIPENPFALPTPPTAGDARLAIAAAAYAALTHLYTVEPDDDCPARTNASTHIAGYLRERLAAFVPRPDITDAGFRFGEKVGRRIAELLEVRAGEPGVDDDCYAPQQGHGKYRADPLNPIAPPRPCPNAQPKPCPSAPRKLEEHHGPFYGSSAARMCTQATHQLADPPAPLRTDPQYAQAYAAVYGLGGAKTLNTTIRTPDQTASALFWAYDGANLLGTPPRLYNQILRVVIASRRVGTAWTPAHTDESLRLLTLANVAMADAGIFAWAEKYHFEYWRPLSGVREDDARTGPAGTAGTSAALSGDPFWETLGAPRTNTNGISFKPPFPAYPSGHATFGAAAMQVARRFYADRDGKPLDPRGLDDIAFDMVSDELDGFSRDLYQPYDERLPIDAQPGAIRTRVVRHYDSLWEAIRENALSRVYLGVHWLFDSFAQADGIDGTIAGDGRLALKPIADVHYATTGSRTDADGNVIATDLPIGGVPLGLDIGDDIYDSGLVRTPLAQQPEQIQRRWAEAKPASTMTSAFGAMAADSLEAVETRARGSRRGKATDTHIR